MKTMIKELLRGQEIFVGLEDSKKSWKLCVRSARMIVHEISMPADYTNLIGYFRNSYPDCVVSLLYEAGFSGFSLFDKLTEDGIRCVVIPPHLVTEAKNNKVKTDKRDAKRLAHILEYHDFDHSCFVPDKELREDRQVERTYDQVCRKIISVKNQIRRALEFHGLDEHFRPGEWSAKDYREAEEFITLNDIGENLKFVFTILFEDLHLYLEQKRRILRQLRDIASKERYKSDYELLQTIPGVGAFTAIRLLLEWGDITRFKTAKEFASFTGLTPSEFSTGDSQRKGHITGQGNKIVRKTLVENSWIAIRFDPVLKKKFIEILHRTQNKKIALVAVARKIALRARAILLHHEPYVLGVVQ